MILTKTQQAIARMVSDNAKHKWQDYSSNDRSSARSFILSRVDKPSYKQRKDLLLTLADALQDDIWKVL
jgi:hypothetical protein